jgi:hypothetical protein
VGLSASCDEGRDQDSHEDEGDLSTGKGEHKGLRRGNKAQQASSIDVMLTSCSYSINL